MYQYNTDTESTVVTENTMEMLSTGGIGEVGTVSLTDEWKTISLNEQYSNPVILAGLTGRTSSDAAARDDHAVPRIKNVVYREDMMHKGWSFDIRLQEPVQCVASYTFISAPHSPPSPTPTFFLSPLMCAQFHTETVSCLIGIADAAVCGKSSRRCPARRNR